MSQRASGFERKGADEYMTPEWCVQSMLSVEHVTGTVWEPACGEGAIKRALSAHDHSLRVLASDINPQFAEHSFDFLTASADFSGHQRFTVVTNPPYGIQGRLAEKFVRHAVSLTQLRRGKVIMLLPVEWGTAKTRADLFEFFPGFINKIELTERIRWTNLPQSKSGPSQNHAWFVWDWARKGRDCHWIGRVA